MQERNNDKMVSVIMPTYNSSKYVKYSVLSVLNQTYNNIELIIIDDNSNDDTVKIIREMNSNLIRLLINDKNYGAGFSRNRGLRVARGSYIAFLDSDDIWKKNKIIKQLQIMKDSNVPFSYTAISMIDENGNIIKKKRSIPIECNYYLLLRNTVIATSSVLIDRNYYGDFDMPLRRGGQDYATWLKLLKDGSKAIGINEALTLYRVTNNSLSSNKLNSIRQVWEIQTKDEQINKISAMVNILFFVVNAFKKHYL